MLFALYPSVQFGAGNAYSNLRGLFRHYHHSRPVIRLLSGADAASKEKGGDFSDIWQSGVITASLL